MLTLNALLGTGTALAPLLIAVFLALGAWWLLPVLAAAALAGFLASVRIPLDPGPTPQRTAPGRVRLPARCWWYAAEVLLYGMCETLFGNWSSVYLTGERGLSAQTGIPPLGGHVLRRTDRRLPGSATASPRSASPHSNGSPGSASPASTSWAPASPGRSR